MCDSNRLVLITGGARSGKSRLAEEMALSRGGPVVYIATAGVYDAEMAERVKIHRQRRPAHWRTREETVNVPAALLEAPANTATVLVDCLTLWLSNLLLARYEEGKPAACLEQEILAEVDRLLDIAGAAPFLTIIVSNEVGMGVVPATPLGRLFRDLAGRANQRAAARAGKVYLTVAGLWLCLKGGS